MNPELRPRVGKGQRRKRLAFVEERMKGREGAPLTETQGICCTGWCCIGWQGRESGLQRARTPEFDFLGGCSKEVVLIGNMRESVPLPVASTTAKLSDGQRLA